MNFIRLSENRKFDVIELKESCLSEKAGKTADLVHALKLMGGGYVFFTLKQSKMKFLLTSKPLCISYIIKKLFKKK